MNLPQKKSRFILYNSKAYYRKMLFGMLILFIMINLVYIYNWLFHNEVYDSVEHLQAAITFSLFSLFAIIPLFDKRPKLIINSMGIETRHQYISWRDVRNMYLKKRYYMLGGYSLILLVEKDYHEKEEVEFSKMQGIPEELASFIGSYYSTYLKREGKLN